jgi:hypothetical protein
VADAISPPPGTRDLRSVRRSIVLNAAVPALLYALSTRYLGASEVAALSIAAIFPALDSLWGVLRQRRLDVIAVIALLSIAVSMIGVAVGGSPRILLIRESFFTGALGLACFLSLLLPRPLMFYFGRQFSAGSDPVKLAHFNAGWQHPAVRRLHRVITVVWGGVFLGEFLIRVALVLTLPPVVVLAVSPFITGGIVVLAIIWTFAHVRRKVRGRVTADAAPSAG